MKYHIIRQWRIDAGLGLRETARGVGISPSLLSAFECGKSQMSWPNMVKLARHIGSPLGVVDRRVIPPELSPEPSTPLVRLDNSANGANEPSTEETRCDTGGCLDPRHTQEPSTEETP